MAKDRSARSRDGERMSAMDTKILIVDDDPYICEAFQVNLETEGYQVKIANDGVEAVNAFKQRKIRTVASFYLKWKGKIDSTCRFDVVEILDDKLTHIENCF